MGQTRLTVVSGEMEAEILVGLLRENGIPSFYKSHDFAAGASEGVGSGGAP